MRRLYNDFILYMGCEIWAFGHWLALVGVMTAILGVFLTIYAVINNKTLKEVSRLTREEIGKIAELILSDGEKTREVLKRFGN